jgi:hypothetical protein
MILNQEEIAQALVFGGHCSSSDEAVVLAELVLNDFHDDMVESNDADEDDTISKMINLLQDYLGLEEDQAKKLTNKLIHREDASLIDAEEDSDNESILPISDDERITMDEEEDEIPLFYGECELCDRYIRLTKHHLIPKSTWSRIESRLRNAADAKEKGDIARAAMLLGPGLMHILEQLEAKRSCIRAIMCNTCDICRPCHNTVHRTHDNMTLALSYSTVDQLLNDERIAKFCKWASKQRPGKYAVK